MPKNHRYPAGIAVLRRETGPVVLINGRRLRLNQTLTALLACLVDDLGCVIPYERLCSVIGHKSTRFPDRHVLRQYIRSLRGVLVTHKAPYVIAVVDDFGYGLCEIAVSAGRASTRGHGTAEIDLPELGRTVRRLRTAAGLTQTALAKRFGDRAYLSDLEKGLRNPTALTLGRLARRVPPENSLRADSGHRAESVQHPMRCLPFSNC
jgi:Helix-turn-helix/Transcriptional regulatory protein, C terminal